MTRNDRGIVLVMALVLALLFAAIAEGLARIAFERVLLYRKVKDSHYSSFATSQALSEVRACLNGDTPGPTCPGDWTPWSCAVGGSSCSTKKTFQISAPPAPRADVEVSVTWTAESLAVSTRFLDDEE